MKEVFLNNSIEEHSFKYFILCKKYIAGISGYLVAHKLIDEFHIENVEGMDFNFLLR
ncbi:hypothetical protein [Aquibacillus albus]|uniref:Uncharacterized protein n=1 Tax=Aquibacillus albus TaxID=1168171 RepID=A0ABS2N2R8_9BACI|nr:hypothetical protein [Aquibacillus albus]MBM7572384.1 hypothetical protein [Aquibacillus albus]